MDGASVTLTCNPTSSSMPTPVAYSWFSGSTVIASATQDTYTINPVALTDTGSYTCSVSANGVSSSQSAAHQLSGTVTRF